MDRKSLIEHILDLFAHSQKDDVAISRYRQEFSKAPVEDYKIRFEEDRCIIQPPVSRRAFFGLTAAVGGMLALDPFLPNSVVYAYGDENSEGYGFVITVLSKEELGVVAIDTTKDPGKSGRENRLSDVEVTITSLFNTQQTTTGKTDSNGIMVKNVKALSEEANDTLVDRYEFWGTLYGHKNGYRDFETGMVRFASGPPTDGRGYVVTTQPLDGKPYARLLTYDGYDIQYSTTTIAIASGNDREHIIQLKVAVESGKQVQATLIHNGTTKGTAQARSQNGIALLEFKGYFNREFAPGGITKVQFAVDNKGYEIVTRLVCAKMSNLDDGQQKKGAISPGGNTEVASLEGDVEMSLGADHKIVLPQDIPLIGGLELSADLPRLPVYIVIMPPGRIVIASNIQDFKLFNSKDGKSSWQNWKMLSKEDWETYKKRREADTDKAIESAGKALENAFRKGSMFGTAPFVGNLIRKMTFEFSIVLELDKDSFNIWEGRAGLTVGFIFGYSGTKVFVIGIIPLYIGFDISFKAMIGATIGMKVKGLFDSVEWAPSKNGLTVSGRLEFGLSAGVGISGFIAAGVRGFVFIQIIIAFVNSGSKPCPHINVGAGMGAEVVVQAFMFKAKKTILDKQWPKLYDNWPKQTGDSTTYLTESLFGGQLGEHADEEGLTSGGLEIVTNETLLASAEFVAEVTEDQEGNENFVYSSLYDASTGYPCGGLDIIEPFDEVMNVMKYDIAQGVKPATDVCIFKQIYSDPRCKILKVEGRLFLLRIATVSVTSLSDSLDPDKLVFGSEDDMVFAEFFEDGSSAYPTQDESFPMPDEETLSEQADGENGESPLDLGGENNAQRGASTAVSRSRITISEFDTASNTWGKAEVIDFPYRTEKLYNPNKLKRADMYDYEFDAIEAGGRIHICLISGTRKEGDKTEWWQARNRMVGSYVCYNPFADKVKVLLSVTEYKAYGAWISVGAFSYAYLSLSMPRIRYVDVGSKYATCVQAFFAGTYRGSEVKDSDNEEISRHHHFSLWVDAAGGMISPPEEFESFQYTNYSDNSDCQLSKGIIAKEARMLLAEVFQRTRDKSEGTRWLAIRGFSFGIDPAKIKPSYTAHIVGNVVPYPGDKGGFLFARRKEGVTNITGQVELCHVYSTKFELDTDGFYFFTMEEKVLSLIAQKPFTVSDDGTWIFTTENKDGTLPGIDLDDITEGQPTELVGSIAQEEIKLYQVIGAKMFKGTNTFSEFFPLAQLSKPTDQLTCTPSLEEGVAFVYNTITNEKDAKSDLFYTGIPWVASLQLDGAAPQEIFLGAKDICHMVFNVQNTGNVPVRGFMVEILDKSGAKLFEVTVNELKSALVPNTDMVDPVTGEPVIDEVDALGILLPGRSRLYRGEFTIPESWKGTVDLSARLVGIQPAKLENGEVVDDDLPSIVRQTDKEPSAFLMDMDSATIVLDGSGSNYYASWDVGDDGDKGGGKGGKMPYTGDPSKEALALLAAALGLGGAGYAAYKGSGASEE